MDQEALRQQISEVRLSIHFLLTFRADSKSQPSKAGGQEAHLSPTQILLATAQTDDELEDELEFDCGLMELELEGMSMGSSQELAPAQFQVLETTSAPLISDESPKNDNPQELAPEEENPADEQTDTQSKAGGENRSDGEQDESLHIPDLPPDPALLPMPICNDPPLLDIAVENQQFPEDDLDQKMQLYDEAKHGNLLQLNAATGVTGAQLDKEKRLARMEEIRKSFKSPVIPFGLDPTGQSSRIQSTVTHFKE
jgi:hypothetical protein